MRASRLDSFTDAAFEATEDLTSLAWHCDRDGTRAAKP